MGEVQPRWLRPEDAARYVGRRVDELPRLVKAGKLPQPSRHFGPRSPRYDRLELDQIMGGRKAENDADAIFEKVRERIWNQKPRRQKKAG